MPGRGVNGLYYAGLTGASPPVTVRGEDATDLRDEIRRVEARYRNWWEPR